VDDNAEVIRLLTEIRDIAAEDAISRRKMVEESLRLQRVAVRRQLYGLAIIGLIIIGAALAIFLAAGSSENRPEKNLQAPAIQQ
jgi:hypothetical protein